MGATSSQGTTLTMGTTAIGLITSFTGPGGSAAVIDASHLGSNAKEKLMGLPDEGQFSFDINFDPANTGHKAVADARAARSLQSFTLTLSTDDEVSFSGYVTGFSIQGGVDALIAGSVTIEITGPVTWPVAA